MSMHASLQFLFRIQHNTNLVEFWGMCYMIVHQCFANQYEIKKSCLRVNAYANTGKPVFFRKMLITRHQVALELSEMYQETQNSILHRTAIRTFFRKIWPWTLCFHFTSTETMILKFPERQIKTFQNVFTSETEERGFANFWKVVDYTFQGSKSTYRL